MRRFILFLIAVLLPVIGMAGIFSNEKELPSDSIQASIKKDASRGATEEIEVVTNIAKEPEQTFLKNFYPTSASLVGEDTIFNSSLSLFLESNKAPQLLPLRNWEVFYAEVEAGSAIAVEFPAKRILYAHNIQEARPIASISKLMSALVAVESLPYDAEIIISEQAVATEGDLGKLVVDEKLTLEQLLYALLLESSNDAAAAIEEFYNLRRTDKADTFTAAMNQKAAEFALKNTFFAEPTGLSAKNTATAYDVVLMLEAVLQNEKLREIIATPVYETQSVSGDVSHRWVNTNPLVGAYAGAIGGKTGYTEEAGETMVFAINVTKDRRVLVAVLGSPDRLEATKNFLNWVKDAYIWQE